MSRRGSSLTLGEQPIEAATDSATGSKRNKKLELKALDQSQRLDIIAYVKSGGMSAGVPYWIVPGSTGVTGRGVSLYVIEGLECMELTVGNGTVENLWKLYLLLRYMNRLLIKHWTVRLMQNKELND
ncbi:hypothetical protein TURU_138215 [Turdus rufiventris]|nr:hypothetical protein TURU_138215 [Turdus rufiventris]